VDAEGTSVGDFQEPNFQVAPCEFGTRGKSAFTQGDHQAADGVHVLDVFEVSVKKPFQAPQRDVGCYGITGVDRNDVFGLAVFEFITDLSDQQFHDVLQRDHARAAPVFVQDDGHVSSAGSEVLKEVRQGAGFRDQESLLGDFRPA